MNSNLHIQKLLAFSDEYNEFQELDILIESPFIKETSYGNGIYQVFLGLSPTLLLIAHQRLVDYKVCPEVIKGINAADLDIEGVELFKAIPLNRVKLKITGLHRIKVAARKKPAMFFELCNNRLGPNTIRQVWQVWVKLIKRLDEGLPLNTNALHDNDPVDGYMSNRLLCHDCWEDYDDRNMHHFHELARSYTTMNEHLKKCYANSFIANCSERCSVLSDSIAHDSSELENENEAGFLNKNNAANENPVSTAKIKSDKRFESENQTNTPSSSFLQNKETLLKIDNTTPAKQLPKEGTPLTSDLKNVGPTGRQFIRSSSIIVRPNGREEPAGKQSKIKTRNIPPTFEHTEEEVVKPKSVKPKKRTEGGKVAKKRPSPTAITRSQQRRSSSIPIDDTHSSKIESVSLNLTAHPSYTETSNSENINTGLTNNHDQKIQKRNEPFHSGLGNHYIDGLNAIPRSMKLFNPQTEQFIQEGTIKEMTKKQSSFRKNKLNNPASEKSYKKPHAPDLTGSQKSTYSSKVSSADASEAGDQSEHSNTPVREQAVSPPIVTDFSSPQASRSIQPTSRALHSFNSTANVFPSVIDHQTPPTWLNAKQKYMFDQLQILLTLDDDIDFDVYECILPCTDSNCSEMQSSDIDAIVAEVQGQKVRQHQPSDKPQSRWSFLKAFHNPDKYTVFESDVTPLPAATQLTLKAINILQDKYNQSFKRIVKWNTMARQIDIPDFPKIKELVVGQSNFLTTHENTNQNQNCTSDEPKCYEKPGSTKTIRHTENNSGSSSGVKDFSNFDDVGMFKPFHSSLYPGRLTSRLYHTWLLEEIPLNSSYTTALDKDETDTFKLTPYPGACPYQVDEPENTSNNAKTQTSQRNSKLTSNGSSPKAVELQNLSPANVSIKLTEQSANNKEFPPTSTIKSPSGILVPECDSALLKYPAEDIAKELTLIDRGLIIQLNLYEMSNSLLHAPHQMTSYQPCMAITKLAERYHNFFISEVLRCRDKQIQIEMIKHLISVCEMLFKYSNYNSLFILSGSLYSHPLSRLDYIWLDLKKRYATTYKFWKKCLNFVNEKESYQIYKNMLDKSMKKMETKPYIPFIGLLIEDVYLLTLKNIALINEKNSNERSDENNTLEVKNKIKESLQKEMASTSTKESFYAQLVLRLTNFYTIQSGLDGTPPDQNQHQTLHKQLLTHQMASVHYDFNKNEELRGYLLRSPYNCEIKNYITSMKLKHIA